MQPYDSPRNGLSLICNGQISPVAQICSLSSGSYTGTAETNQGEKKLADTSKANSREDHKKLFKNRFYVSNCDSWLLAHLMHSLQVRFRESKKCTNRFYWPTYFDLWNNFRAPTQAIGMAELHGATSSYERCWYSS